MEITLNGIRKITDKNTIYELMEELEFLEKGVVVLHNEKIVKKEEMKVINLENKDCVEILYFVSGG